MKKKLSAICSIILMTALLTACGAGNAAGTNAQTTNTADTSDVAVSVAEDAASAEASVAADTATAEAAASSSGDVSDASSVTTTEENTAQAGSGTTETAATGTDTASGTPVVYFTSDISAQGLVELYELIDTDE